MKTAFYPFFTAKFSAGQICVCLTEHLQLTGEKRVVHEKVEKHPEITGNITNRQNTTLDSNDSHTWDLWIATGSYDGDSTMANISMAFYGPQGSQTVEGHELRLESEIDGNGDKEALFQVGATDHFAVRAPNKV